MIGINADYCFREDVPDVDTVYRILAPHFDVWHLVMVRNLTCSFFSLSQNGSVHVQPNSFDEYCGRLQLFLEPFSKEQIMKYEDFVAQQQEEIKTVQKHT